jgi:pSer/pThr/pTyr-binding forkhead associated (FHA) protein
MPFQIRFENQEPIVLEGDRYSIGRSPKCDIQLVGKEISGNHATLERVGNQWKIKDNESSNVTFVNGISIAEQLLNPGDKIRLNGSAIAFFSKVWAEAETLVDTPTHPGDVRPELKALADRMERSYEENRSFHEDLAAQMHNLSEKVEPLVCRVDALEDSISQFSGVAQIIHEIKVFRTEAKKVIVSGLAGGGFVALIVFASALSQDHSTRNDVIGSFVGQVVEEIGGPEVIGSGVATLLLGGSAFRLKSSKSKQQAEEAKK